MQFNSFIFILALLPATVILYFIANKISFTLGKLVVLLANVIFYAYGGLTVFAIFVVSMIVNYSFSYALEKVSKYRKLLMGLAVAANVAVLFYFKYFKFFLTSVNSLIGGNISIPEVLLPVGISFYTFQQIMYVVNVYRKQIEKNNLLDYLVYITYFPKLLVGPITEPLIIIDQLNNKDLKKVNWDNVANGLKIFSFGLFKKVVIADTFTIAINWILGNLDEATSMDMILLMVFCSFEIYFDFSGYADMATGISLILNIELPINFDSPYKAISVRDYWRRWHLTLTGFLTRYIYFPIGGSRKGKVRTYVNILFVFFVSGLWHGANWTFILWGVGHGIFEVLDRLLDKFEEKIWKPIRWVVTFIIICLLRLLFKAETVGQWFQMLVKMFSFENMTVSNDVINSFMLPEFKFVANLLGINAGIDAFALAVMILLIVLAFFICLVPQNNYRNLKKNNAVIMIAAAVAFAWAFMGLSVESVFVYMNF